jgi:hypothetical protein
MLQDNERSSVVEEMALQMTYAGLAGAGNLVVDWLGTVHGPRTETDARFAVWARNILRYCERYGWIENPALLLALLQRLIQHPRGPQAPLIPPIQTRIANLAPPLPFPPGGRAWDTCFLAVELPFLGRGVTRTAFEDFDNPLGLKPNAARVLVVNGPPGSGKTFTGDFLRLLVGLHPNTTGVASLDFATWRGEALEADVLARQLASQMTNNAAAAEPVSPPDAQREERWGRSLAIWLERVAHGTGRVWHLLLDNFHLPGVPLSAHLFIDELLSGLSGRPIAWDAPDRDMGPSLRLVLLGYERPLKERNDLVRVDNIGPITPAELRTHFRGFYQWRQWPVDDPTIDAIVERYETRLAALFPAAAGTVPGVQPAPPRWRMKELAEVVRRECVELERQHLAASGAAGANPGIQ